MPLYRHVAVAADLSPVLPALLAEAVHHLGDLTPRLSLIHAGPRTDEREARLRQIAQEAGLAEDAPIYWEEGDAGDAILRVAHREDVDLLVAAALEKEHPLRYYLGSVAHNLAREAPCSLLLITEPEKEPRPIRRLVLVTDYTESAQIALARAIQLAESEGTEDIYVIRVLSEYGKAMVMADGYRRDGADAIQATTPTEEEDLLRDFVDAAGKSDVPITAKCIEGRTGRVAAQFVREVEADLLVMPSANRYSHFFTRLFPVDMEWVLREIPCTLWVARENSSVG